MGKQYRHFDHKERTLIYWWIWGHCLIFYLLRRSGLNVIGPSQGVPKPDPKPRKTRGYRTPKQLISQAPCPAGGEVIALTL